MRNSLFAASAIAALAVPGAASAQYYNAADIYAPPPAAYVAPAPGAYVTPAPGAYLAPGPGAPMVQSQVYLAPGTTYAVPPTITVTPQPVAPGIAYDDQAIYANGQRYYRDCWWDWGRRRCDLKPWW